LSLDFIQVARHHRFISEKAAAAYGKASDGSHEARWYFTGHELKDPQSPRVRFD